MAFVSPRMSLKVWNSPSDPYDHEQLADNFLKLDIHDHSAGRGAQVGAAGIQNGAITSSHIAPAAIGASHFSAGAITPTVIGTGTILASNLAVGADPTGLFTSPRILRSVMLTISTIGPGAYAMETSNPSAAAAVAGTAWPGAATYWDWSDYAITGKTTNVRLRYSMHNPSAQTLTATVGLYAVTSTSTTATIGATICSGVMTNPGAGYTTGVTNEVAVPANGTYMIQCTTSAANVGVSTVKAQMQLRYA